MKKIRGENIFDFLNAALLALLAFLAVYPFLYTFSISLSDAAEAQRQGLHLVPGNPALLIESAKALVRLDFQATGQHFQAFGDGLSLTAYRMVLANREILIGYANTIFRTVLGTFLTLLATAMAAYPLSRKEMPWRKRMVFFLLFTMLFNGGLMPTYLVVKGTGLINNRLVYVLPLLVGVFNILIMKNFFQSIPESLAESARIDGANDFSILFRIYLPLSKPILATVGLWTAVFHWNSWFDGLLYVTNNDKQVLQVLLQRIVIENSTEMIAEGIIDPDLLSFTPETIKAATVIITILPILLLYPFVQKYFVKGIMIGGVKE
jgi:putative aldouronate transport system permease protein